jgi:hypothetical protein
VVDVDGGGMDTSNSLIFSTPSLKELCLAPGSWEQHSQGEGGVPIRWVVSPVLAGGTAGTFHVVIFLSRSLTLYGVDPLSYLQ